MVALGQFKDLDKILGYVYAKDTMLKEKVDNLKRYEQEDFLSDFYIKDGGKMKEIPEEIKKSIILSEALDDDDPYLDESVYKDFDADETGDGEEEEQEEGEEMEEEEQNEGIHDTLNGFI